MKASMVRDLDDSRPLATSRIMYGYREAIIFWCQFVRPHRFSSMFARNLESCILTSTAANQCGTGQPQASGNFR
jgi:hypothetical protein